MSEIKLSIIVPIYNMEKFTGGVLNQFVKQNTDDIEVIIVNDGSTDGTLEALKNQNFPNNFKIISYEKNGGVSYARNQAINVAKGDYVTFVDADDAVVDDFIQRIKNDIKSNKDMYVYEEGINSKSTKAEILINHPGLYNGKVYKLDLINKNDIRYDTKLRVAEDLLFNMKCLSNANTFEIEDYNIYKYLKPNSVYTFNAKNLANETEFHREMIKALKPYSDLKSVINTYSIRGVLFLTDRYFGQLPNHNKDVSLWKSSQKFKKFILSNNYTNYFSNNSNRMSKRDKLIFWLIKHRYYFLSLVTSLAIDKLKGIKR